MTHTTLATTTNTLTTGAASLFLDQNPAVVYLATLKSATSKRTMRQALNAIAALVQGIDLDRLRREQGRDVAQSLCLSFPWSELRYQHTAAIRGRLADTYAPATANKMLSALRGVLKTAWRLGQMTAEDYYQARSVENVSGETLPAGRDISPGELAALMGACEVDHSPAGVRDAAIIGLLYTCGLRRSALVALDLDDYDRDTGTLAIRRKEDGNGPKRGKERLVYPASGAVDALADWLAIRGSEPGPLFHPILKSGTIQRRRISTQMVWKRLKRRARQARVKDVSPHDFRRTFVGDLLDAGVDISTAARLAGHSSVQTTARYDRRPEATKREAAQRLHLPYRQRALLVEQSAAID